MDPSAATFKDYQECGITIKADGSGLSSRKTPFHYSVEDKITRSLVTCILSQYVNSKESVCYPVKCIDVIGSAGTCGLLWKKHLGDKVDVKINDPRTEASELIVTNASKNKLFVDVSTNDPCIVLHERGYNFIYLDCTNDASHYLDSAFRNISRNGVLVITGKDDCSMHGNTPDVALRRYAGRIVRTFYYHELGIRLIIAAMARSAAKYNKSLSVLCCFMNKSSFTIAIMSQKGPALANKMLENIRPIKHCLVCEAREFYPLANGFPVDPNSIQLSCDCASNAPSNTSLELGPVWTGSIFSVKFIEGISGLAIVNTDLELKSVIDILLIEAKCSGKENLKKENVKRLKMDDVSHPPFYYNIHKHHPHLNQLMKINKVVEALKDAGFRASKTHFDKLAVRTDAPLTKLFEIMKMLDQQEV